MKTICQKHNLSLSQITDIWCMGWKIFLKIYTFKIYDKILDKNILISIVWDYWTMFL